MQLGMRFLFLSTNFVHLRRSNNPPSCPSTSHGKQLHILLELKPQCQGSLLDSKDLFSAKLLHNAGMCQLCDLSSCTSRFCSDFVFLLPVELFCMSKAQLSCPAFRMQCLCCPILRSLHRVQRISVELCLRFAVREAMSL